MARPSKKPTGGSVAQVLKMLIPTLLGPMVSSRLKAKAPDDASNLVKYLDSIARQADMTGQSMPLVSDQAPPDMPIMARGREKGDIFRSILGM